jgi:5-methylcytosine-specific restriction protein A
VNSFGDLVPAHVVRRIAADANLQNVTTHNGIPINLGRRYRWATDDQWKVLVARDGHCRWPGCDIPAKWCDVDHLTPWERGGTSNLDNLWLLCRHHHTEKHLPGVTHTGNAHHPQLHLPNGVHLDCPPTPPLKRQPKRTERQHQPPVAA